MAETPVEKRHLAKREARNFERGSVVATALDADQVPGGLDAAGTLEG
jgi:hypothetical protein